MNYYRIVSGVIERVTEPEPGRFVVTGYASTSDPDVDDFVIEPESFRESLPTFMRNPVLLFNHDRDLVIGRITRADIDGRGLKIDAEFDMGDEFSKAKAGQVKRGFLKGFSVGFRALEEPKMAQGKLYFTKNRLLEISLATIPANPNALIGAEADEEAIVARALKTVVDTAEEQVGLAIEAKIREALAGLARASAEGVEQRIGTVRALVDQSLEKRMAEAEAAKLRTEIERLERVVRLEENPSDPGDINGGGGGSGGGDSTPRPAAPYAPPSAGGSEPGGNGDGSSNARPIEGTLVPEFTAEDTMDKHRHRLSVLREDGSGETQIASGANFLPHAHAISGWVVVPVNVAGKVSEHPGSLYPGEQLTADDPVVRELQANAEKLGVKLVRATFARPGDQVEAALDHLRFMFAD